MRIGRFRKLGSEQIRADKNQAKPTTKQEVKAQPVAETKVAPKSNVQKLNGKERQELEGLPQLIEALESEQADIGVTMSNPDLYKNEPELAASMQARLSEITEQFEQKLQRWEQLLSRSES